MPLSHLERQNYEDRAVFLRTIRWHRILKEKWSLSVWCPSLRCSTILKKYIYIYFNFSDVISYATSSCCNIVLIHNHVEADVGWEQEGQSKVGELDKCPATNENHTTACMHACVCVRVCVCVHVAGGWMINACQYGHVYVCQFNLFVDTFVKLWVYVFANRAWVYVCVCHLCPTKTQIYSCVVICADWCVKGPELMCMCVCLTGPSADQGEGWCRTRCW